MMSQIMRKRPKNMSIDQKRLRRGKSYASTVAPFLEWSRQPHAVETSQVSGCRKSYGGRVALRWISAAAEAVGGPRIEGQLLTPE
jgi:hypothetical protein